MRILLLTLLFLSTQSTGISQTTRLKSKKYPSLLWEITGKGATRPSYLFGTMHVSSKMVFHLSDSFYLALRRADVVALETNPGNWQEDFSRYDMDGNSFYGYRNRMGLPNDYLTINTLKAVPYEPLMAAALYSNPSIINSFLYRSNSEVSSEFEEDTYLDLYIYQIGRKWNKKVCGVENFDQSMNLMKEAYADAAKDKNKRMRSYDSDNDFSYAKMEEAYRTGNLDWLDSIHKQNSTSAAFDEKFLYIRNEIQAKSIDSIIRSNASVFAGVGAAHLPGERGVIEMLRRMGYRLRPIRMTERDSRHKEELEAIRVPLTWSQQSADDGFFSVSLPGKLYSFGRSEGVVNQQQYADMGNGSYYMVTRISTQASLWGHSTATVQRKLDSLLYENVPGKILSKKAITRNGYPGYDIVNRTRRGDHQRYQIFVTPFEVILFKASGSGEYIVKGTEADRFFNSIQLKEIKPEWKKFSPSFGGFEVDMPHQPVVQKDESLQFVAFDKATATHFGVTRTDVHNLRFAEEDTFDLNLMEESFGSSTFIDKQLSRKFTRHQGYAALDASYRYKDGSQALVRFLIQGPHYYTLVTQSRTTHPKMQQFLQSFTLKPFVYGGTEKQVDTSLLFTVQSPVPIMKPEKLSMYPRQMGAMDDDEELMLEATSQLKERIISSDSTGEKIYVTFSRPSRYYDFSDTTVKDTVRFKWQNHTWFYRNRQTRYLANGTRVMEYDLVDSTSSRMQRVKTFRRAGVSYRLAVMGDTLTKWTPMVDQVFSTFTPADTVRGIDPSVKRSDLYFADFFSTDTLKHKRAVKSIDLVELDSSDFPQLRKAISSLSWKEKKYLDTKESFIGKVAQTNSREAADFLRDVYYAAADTVDLQYAALRALLGQKTSYAYQVFRNIMLNEPPVLNIRPRSNYTITTHITTRITDMNDDEEEDYGNNRYGFLDELGDSLQLTQTVFKDLLPLIQLDDYERPMIQLLREMVDSNLIAARDYDAYYQKFMLEAKQEMKKQVISEKNRSIEKAQIDPSDKDEVSDREEKDGGNEKLAMYATLLMPFWDLQPAVPALFNGMLASSDKQLKFATAMLMLRNGKKIPDTLLPYFASLDDFRFDLYFYLKKIKQLDKFPAKYNNHIDIARSEVMSVNNYGAPDTLVYLNRFPVQYKDRKGYVYFFKYRKKKDDKVWKIATAGLVPEAANVYSFEAKKNYREEQEYDFSELTDTRIEEDEPLEEQLRKVLKKKLYSKRKSAARFYEDEERYGSPRYFRD